jgi:hypothetical protein
MRVVHGSAPTVVESEASSRWSKNRYEASAGRDEAPKR